MSLTGAPDGQPMKVGVGIADVMCGMYADGGDPGGPAPPRRTGQGQHIDVALLDTQVAWLVNEGMNYLRPARCRSAGATRTPTSSPTRPSPTADGYVILAVGNDAQFRKWCGFAGAAELAPIRAS